MEDRLTAVEPRRRPRSAEAGQGRLGDPAIRSQLERFVGRRVAAGDVDDVVQTVLCAALSAAALPTGDEDLRRWLMGIAKHKVADHHRGAERIRPAETPEIGVDAPPYEARAMVRWAEGAARSEYRSAETLSWMARESEGETLATIAADAELPPDRIRQRVSRLRRTLKDRWSRELALAAGALLLGLLGWLWWSLPAKHQAIHDRWRISPPPAAQRAHQLRGEAMQACEDERWSTCLYGLERAERLDPAGNRKPAIRAARQRAIEALSAPAPQPTSNSTSSPGPSPTTTSTSATPTPPEGTRGKLGPASSPKPSPKPVKTKK